MTTDMAASRDLLVFGDDLSKPRMAVESEKIKRQFPQMGFYATGGTVTSVEGELKTADGNSYYTKIIVPSAYPYEMPSIFLPYTTFLSGCPHKYTNGSICVMKPEQWSSTYSLAFMVAKAAIWVNKYDCWRRKGYWPGKGQEH